MLYRRANVAGGPPLAGGYAKGVMNKVEALSVLQGQLRSWRERSRAQLREKVNQAHRVEVTGASGTRYQVEVQVFWDNKPDGAIRVRASIDDGGWHALLPLNDDFILASDGSFEQANHCEVD